MPTLKNLLQDLLTEAVAMPGHTFIRNLTRGLTISLTALPDRTAQLTLTRLDAEPSPTELKAVLNAWPLPLPNPLPTPTLTRAGKTARRLILTLPLSSAQPPAQLPLIADR